MSLPLSQPYSALSVEETVPNSAKVPSITAASIIQDRRRKRLTPQGNMTITSASPTQIIFNISDPVNYLDLQSVVLCGTFQLTNSAQGGSDWCVLEDGITSLFSRVRVSINSQEITSIGGPGLGRKTAAEVYTSVSQDYYCSQLLNCLFYKFNNRNFANDGDVGATFNQATLNSRVLSARKNEPLVRGQLVEAWQRAGVPFAIPLSLFVPFFRSESLYPLRNCGVMQITLDIAPSNEAFFGTQATPTNAITWTLSDIDLWMDTVSLHPSYLAVMDSLMRDPNETGYKLPYTDQVVMQATVNAATGLKSVQLPRSAKNVRQVMWVSQPTTSLTAFNGAKTAFPSASYVEALIQVGTQRYPDSYVAGLGRAYNELLYANNLLSNPVGGTVVDVENFSNRTFGSGTLDAWSPCFIWAQNLDKVRTEYIAVDGVSTEANGGQITVMVNNDTSAGAHTLSAFIEQTQFLSIQGSKIEVV